ncbi:MAG: hypothetical protein J0I09_07405 [Sphingobacteriia bacterium]|nr:hypothetical protein [Sphingobacteriia bacterium]
MKKIIILIFFACIGNAAIAQEKANYNSKAGKIEFTISDKEIYIEFYEQDAEKIESIAKKFAKFNSTSALVETKGLTGKFADRKSQFKQQTLSEMKIERLC